eukprot:scaffold32701_cov61-Skeletonema_dohrnii-CCMP3373.AAC.1
MACPPHQSRMDDELQFDRATLFGPCFLFWCISYSRLYVFPHHHHSSLAEVPPPPSFVDVLHFVASGL